MRCQRAQQRLMAYHDSELTPGAARKLERHLQSCDECSQMLERLRLADRHATSAAGVEGKAGVPGIPAPDDKYWESFTARVLDRVEEDAAVRAPDRRKPRRKWDLMIPRMAPAFSVALVAVVAAGVIMKMGGPVPAPKAPAVLTEPLPEKGVSVVDKQIPLAESDNGDREYDAAAPAREVRNGVSAYRSTPPAEAAPVEQPRVAPAPEKGEEGASGPAKRSALAGPGAGSQPDEDSAVASAVREGEETLETAEKAKEPLPLDTAMTGKDVIRKEVDGGLAPLPSKGEPDGMEDDAVQVETPQVEKSPPAEALVADTSLETSERREDQTQASALVQEVKPLAPSEPAEVTPSDTTVVATAPPAAIDRQEQERKEETPLPEAQMSEKDLILASEAETLSGSLATQETRQTFAPGLPSYRGPEDQLAHAKNLAEVRKFWESEQVLKNLLSQDPPIFIQEEASILLVKVLTGQNRNEEAQRVLDDARVQFPESEKVQTFQLGPGGETPAQ